VSRSRPKDERGATGAAPRAPAAFVGGPRRVDVLDRARRPLTVLVAPPGSGKTATLALWAAARDTPPVWLDGRRADDRAALADICAGRRQDRVLVVDDAHELSTAELEAVVAAVTRGDLGVVLAARRDLPIPVVALDLSDQLSVLRGDHLRLTPEETTQLVRAHAPDADAADVEAVAARAHGWAAAVVLAAHALSSAADRETARAALVATDQPILDYLLDEVFSALPATTRHVLVCTAHEEQVTDTSARVLSADGEAGARLAQLAVDGMFVTRYDDTARGEPVWVYHPLLIELLHRETARGTPDAVLVAAAHDRAARYYAAVGDPVPALRHAVASDDDALVAELLVRLGPRLLAAGHHPVVRRALQTVPVALRTGSPGVSAIDALERQAVGDVEAVLCLVAEQGACPAEGETVEPATAPPAALVRADEIRVRLWLTRAGMGDTRGAAAEAERLLADASAGRGAGALDATRSSALHAELAYARLLLDDTAGASWHAQQAAALGRAVGTPLIEADALAVNAVLELLAGRFQTAAAEAGSALDLVRSAATVTTLDGREHREGRSDADGHRAPDRVRPAAPEAVLHAVLGWAAYYARDGSTPRSTPSRRRSSGSSGPSSWPTRATSPWPGASSPATRVFPSSRRSCARYTSSYAVNWRWAPETWQGPGQEPPPSASTAGRARPGCWRRRSSSRPATRIRSGNA
jgi:hypothetical protein